MANSYFAAGLAANGCVNAQGLVVTNEHALADFQKAKLQNGKPWEPFISGAAVANWEAVFDMNMVPDPSFEAGTDGQPAADWTTESGTPTVSTDQAHDGTKSLRLNAAGEAAYRERDVVAGKRYRLEVALYGGGAENVEFYLIDTKTGKYKTSASETSWSATPTALFTKSTTGFVNNTQTLVVDPQATAGSGITTLRLRARKATGTQATYVDLVLLYPEIDFASIHDHNLPDNVSIEIHRSDNNFGGDDDTETTLPTRRVRTYSKFPPTSTTPKRWWKELVSGTPFNPFSLGQPFLGSVWTFTKSPDQDYNVRGVMPQSGIDTPLPTNLALEERLAMDFTFLDERPALDQIAEQFFRSSGHGAEPVIVVPDDTQYEIIHGRVGAERRFQRTAGAAYRYGFTLVEDPFVIPSN